MSNKRKEQNKDYENAYCDQRVDSYSRNYNSYQGSQSKNPSDACSTPNGESSTPRFHDKKEVVDVVYLYKLVILITVLIPIEAREHV